MTDGFIYLIQANNLYKIGVTKNYNINARLKQLQTANGTELKLITTFKSKHPFELEKRLHRYYKDVRCNGEWFNIDDISNFTEICEENEKILIALEDNPFFYKKNKRYNDY